MAGMKGSRLRPGLQGLPPPRRQAHASHEPAPPGEPGPAELMSAYARQDAHRGCKARCPRGSGRIWKRCHGAPLTLATAV